MDRNYIEKKIRKYVIATLGNPTMYLRKIPSKPEYCFVEEIDLSTKALSKFVMKQILNYFYLDTGLNMDFVIVPIDITYEIIDEDNTDT